MSHAIAPPTVKPIGLLAGSGRFPILFAQKARRSGLPIVCVGVRHEAPPELAGLVSQFHWAGVAQLGRHIGCFVRAGVEQVVMAGKINKSTFLHKPWRIISLLPDWRTVRFWYSRNRRDNADDSLLLAMIDEYAKDGLRFTSALDFCPELLVRPGLLTHRPLNSREELDVAFGWELAKEMGRLDVGQSVVVKDRAILAVEAIEGTDRAILRAGELCRAGGFVVVKVAKPHQDMRFDVPTVGKATIETMHKSGGKVLAIEADRTIVLDRAETVALADRLGVTIVAVDRAAA